MLLRRSFAIVRRFNLSRRFLSEEKKAATVEAPQTASAPSSSANPNTFGNAQNPTISPTVKRNNAIIGLIVGGTALSIYMFGIQKLKKDELDEVIRREGSTVKPKFE